ncbi:type 2A phosphatase-associated protein 42 [Polyplosphaeria fusca]|uniref:Type 2A phosphatase-associated protein 42 n=1 Tax=Polyplosphaeria fusca TaxID=682080 RepID=A0A9P4R8Y3_9PLEO|nr:type 2A phosphatase-associated protein 42 [Polyplosphaeria fusca]
MDDQPKSLRALFLEAEHRREGLSAFPSTNTPTYQEALQTAIALYEASLKQSEQVSLFSPNESLDDVSSTDLHDFRNSKPPPAPPIRGRAQRLGLLTWLGRYMTIGYQLAELVQKIAGSVAERKANLLRARGFYERFLKLLDSYDVLSKSDARLLEAYAEDREQFTATQARDAAARREAKIARFRAEMELKRKLEYLRQNPKLAEQDEQVVRELHLTNIAFMVHQTFQSLESMAQELHIISLAPSAPPQDPTAPTPDDRQNGRRSDNYSDRLDTPSGSKFSGPILDSSGKPLRPFTLLDTRQRLQKGVFRPDHNLPTMTIDEYLEEEKRRGGIIEGGGEQSGIRPEVDEDDLDKADEETMKARAWDEYTEDNPKGSGNTLNRG